MDTMMKCRPADRARVIAALGEPLREKLVSGGSELRMYWDDQIPPSTNEVNATDAAIILADELGIDLSTVSGSGPDGRIIKRDITALT